MGSGRRKERYKFGKFFYPSVHSQGAIANSSNVEMVNHWLVCLLTISQGQLSTVIFLVQAALAPRVFQFLCCSAALR